MKFNKIKKLALFSTFLSIVAVPITTVTVSSTKKSLNATKGIIYNDLIFKDLDEATKYYIRNNLSSIDKIQVTGVDKINNGNITSFQDLDYSKISNAYLNVYNNPDYKKDNALNTYYNDPIIRYKVNQGFYDTYEYAQDGALASLYENIIPTYSFNPVDNSTSSNIVINPMNYYDVKYLKAQVWDNMILDIFTSQNNYSKDYGNWKYKIGIKDDNNNFYNDQLFDNYEELLNQYLNGVSYKEWEEFYDNLSDWNKKKLINYFIGKSDIPTSVTGTNIPTSVTGKYKINIENIREKFKEKINNMLKDSITRARDDSEATIESKLNLSSFTNNKITFDVQYKPNPGSSKFIYYITKENGQFKEELTWDPNKYGGRYGTSAKSGKGHYWYTTNIIEGKEIRKTKGVQKLEISIDSEKKDYKFTYSHSLGYISGWDSYYLWIKNRQPIKSELNSSLNQYNLKFQSIDFSDTEFEFGEDSKNKSILLKNIIYKETINIQNTEKLFKDILKESIKESSQSINKTGDTINQKLANLKKAVINIDKEAGIKDFLSKIKLYIYYSDNTIDGKIIKDKHMFSFDVGNVFDDYLGYEFREGKKYKNKTFVSGKDGKAFGKEGTGNKRTLVSSLQDSTFESSLQTNKEVKLENFDSTIKINNKDISILDNEIDKEPENKATTPCNTNEIIQCMFNNKQTSQNIEEFLKKLKTSGYFNNGGKIDSKNFIINQFLYNILNYFKNNKQTNITTDNILDYTGYNPDPKKDSILNYFNLVNNNENEEEYYYPHSSIALKQNVYANILDTGSIDKFKRFSNTNFNDRFKTNDPYYITRKEVRASLDKSSEIDKIKVKLSPYPSKVYLFKDQGGQIIIPSEKNNYDNTLYSSKWIRELDVKNHVRNNNSDMNYNSSIIKPGKIYYNLKDNEKALINSEIKHVYKLVVSKTNTQFFEDYKDMYNYIKNNVVQPNSLAYIN